MAGTILTALLEHTARGLTFLLGQHIMLLGHHADRGLLVTQHRLVIWTNKFLAVPTVGCQGEGRGVLYSNITHSLPYRTKSYSPSYLVTSMFSPLILSVV